MSTSALWKLNSISILFTTSAAAWGNNSLSRFTIKKGMNTYNEKLLYKIVGYALML